MLALGATWAWSAARLASLLNEGPAEVEPWHHAIVFGWLGALADCNPHEVLTAYLHQAALGMIGAGSGPSRSAILTASRCWPISTTTSATWPRARRPRPGGRRRGCPFYEILCDEQTQLYARMFRS